MSAPLPVHVKAMSYQVTCLPDDNPERRQFTLEVVCRNLPAGHWAVIDRRGYCLGLDGTWEYESIPSERRDEWLATHRFTRNQAMDLAIAAAPLITIGPDENPFTVSDFMQEDWIQAHADRLANAQQTALKGS